MTDKTKQVPSLAELRARKPIESTTLVFMTEAERDALLDIAEAAQRLNADGTGGPVSFTCGCYAPSDAAIHHFRYALARIRP